ncbi:hypothetical protein Taro_053735 [Colocasia esculenta]|uniref:Uncharacterized protein n=1 Tax=Colocasia esculenta TaxID=4460 RepID=A0A843XLR3_COLES|nr:hypothetical protein [Colocasia esculenta]
MVSIFIALISCVVVL